MVSKNKNKTTFRAEGEQQSVRALLPYNPHKVLIFFSRHAVYCTVYMDESQLHCL